MNEAFCAKCCTSPATETIQEIPLCPSCVKTCNIMTEALIVYLQGRLGALSDEKKESYKRRLLRVILAAHPKDLIIYTDTSNRSN